MTQKDGSSAELNKGCSGSPSYLWYHTGEQQGDPIAEIVIIDVSEDTPEGFERMARTFIKNGRSGMVLCFRRDTEVDPVGSITLVYGDDTPPDGYERLEVNVNPDGTEAYICFKRFFFVLFFLVLFSHVCHL